MKITDASCLTNAELTTELNRLASGEREATVALIVHLSEFDARRLYEPAGFSSTFSYCQEVLRLSEDAASNRIAAARAARKYPAIVDMLMAGDLSPTTARMLARHLTAENHAQLLSAASGKSKQEVEKLLARFFPQLDVPSSVRPFRSTNPMPPVAATMSTPAAGASQPGCANGDPPIVSFAAADGPAPASGPGPAPASHARPVVRPLSAERYEIRFTVPAETYEKLRLAQDLLASAVPSGDLAHVFDWALTLLVADLQRKKFGATERPRPARGQSEDSRNIPAAVRREVSRRDDRCCAFIAASGRRCRERRHLHFHHVTPYAVGGKPTVDNIQLRCRAHNRHEADLFYGPSRRYGGGLPVPERVAGGPTSVPGSPTVR
jgi:hypothetical protein